MGAGGTGAGVLLFALVIGGRYQRLGGKFRDCVV